MPEILFSGFNLEEFKEILSEVIDQKLKEHSNKSLGRKNNIEYLTRVEVCSLLRISLPTLTDYVKKGYIKSGKIGNSVRFLPEDVEDAIKNIHSFKFRKKI